MAKLDEEVRAAERREWLARAKYCPRCEFWLNGEEQWFEHHLGKKHRRRTRKMLEERLHLSRLLSLAWAAVPEEPTDELKQAGFWRRRVGTTTTVLPLLLLGLLFWGFLGTLCAWTTETAKGVLWWGGHSEDTYLHGLLVIFCLGMSWASATLGTTTVAPASN